MCHIVHAHTHPECLRGRARGRMFFHRCQILSSSHLHPGSRRHTVTAPMIILVITKLLCRTWKFNFLVGSCRELSLLSAKNPWTFPEQEERIPATAVASGFLLLFFFVCFLFFKWSGTSSSVSTPFKSSSRSFLLYTYTSHQSGCENTSSPWKTSNSFQFIPWLWISSLHCLKKYNSIYWVLLMCQALCKSICIL